MNFDLYWEFLIIFEKNLDIFFNFLLCIYLCKYFKILIEI